MKTKRHARIFVHMHTCAMYTHTNATYEYTHHRADKSTNQTLFASKSESQTQHPIYKYPDTADFSQPTFGLKFRTLYQTVIKNRKSYGNRQTTLTGLLRLCLDKREPFTNSRRAFFDIIDSSSTRQSQNLAIRPCRKDDIFFIRTSISLPHRYPHTYRISSTRLSVFDTESGILWTVQIVRPKSNTDISVYYVLCDLIFSLRGISIHSAFSSIVYVEITFVCIQRRRLPQKGVCSGQPANELNKVAVCPMGLIIK